MKDTDVWLYRQSNWKIMINGEIVENLAADEFLSADEEGVRLNFLITSSTLKKLKNNKPRKFKAMYFDASNTITIKMKVEKYTIDPVVLVDKEMPTVGVHLEGVPEIKFEN